MGEDAAGGGEVVESSADWLHLFLLRLAAISLYTRGSSSISLIHHSSLEATRSLHIIERRLHHNAAYQYY